MSAIDIVGLLLNFIGGGLIGLFYFGGLWWTVQQLPTTRRPALLIFASFFLRLTLTLLAFYLLAWGHWPWLLSSIVGFFVMRIMLTRLWGLELHGQENKL